MADYNRGGGGGGDSYLQRQTSQDNRYHQAGANTLNQRYGSLAPKKKPLISKDHERAFFDSADWALCKQGAMDQKSTVIVESLRPKLQRTPHQQLPPRRPTCSSGRDPMTADN